MNPTLRRLSLVLAPLLLATTGATVHATDTGVTPTVTPAACPPVGVLEVEGQTVECGTVSVPVDYSDPEGETYELAFVVHKARSLAPFTDPVIYLEGGPGVASLANLEDQLGNGSFQDLLFDELRDQRDVIWFDQRSTGLSTGPLDCSTEIAGALLGLTEDAEAQFDDPDVQQLAISDAVIEACLTVFEGRGADIAQVNTENNARDVALLAQALGYDDFNLFGISYGTRLALEVMRQAPEGLRSVIIDSVSAPDVPGYAEDGIPFDQAVQQLFVMCAEDEACAAAYPDLQARFSALLDQLAAEPIDLGDELLDADAVLEVLDRRNTQRGLSAYMPQMIAELEQGVVDTYEAIVNSELPPATPREPSELQQAVNGRIASLPYGSLVAAQSAARTYQQGNELQDEALRLFRSLVNLDEPAQPTLAQQFDRQVTEPFGRTISRYVLDDDTIQAYLALPLGEATAAALIDFVDEHFDGLARDQLVALANAMTPEDIEALFGLIHGESLALEQGMAQYVTLLYYVCNENIPFNSPAAFDASRERYAFPQIADKFEDPIKNVLAICDDYPDTWSEATEFHTPVVSDIPTLVMVGNNDTQTAFSSGQRVLETLSNGQLVEFPDAGHGAIANGGQCSKDIASAFMDAPLTAVNDACVESLRPVFVVPEEPDA